MKEKNIPQDIILGLENYRSQIADSNILLRKTKDLIFQISDNKIKINTRQIHIKGIALLLKSVFDVIICSSLIMEKDRFIDNQDCLDKLSKVEKININWLPEMLDSNNKIINSETSNITQDIIKEHYNFLLELCSNDLMSDFSKLDFEEEQKLIMQLELIIKNISKLMFAHKITLYNFPYFYTIQIAKNVIESNIIAI